MNYGINVYLLNQLTFPIMIGIKLVFAKRMSHKTSPFIPISHPKSFIIPTQCWSGTFVTCFWKKKWSDCMWFLQFIGGTSETEIERGKNPFYQPVLRLNKFLICETYFLEMSSLYYTGVFFITFLHCWTVNSKLKNDVKIIPIQKEHFILFQHLFSIK